MVELRETVQEITIPKYAEVEQAAPRKPPLFAQRPDDALLSDGVPSEWLPDVRQVNEDTVRYLADHLPSEAAEALWTVFDLTGKSFMDAQRGRNNKRVFVTTFAFVNHRSMVHAHSPAL